MDAKIMSDQEQKQEQQNKYSISNTLIGPISNAEVLEPTKRKRHQAICIRIYKFQLDQIDELIELGIGFSRSEIIRRAMFQVLLNHNRLSDVMDISFFDDFSKKVPMSYRLPPFLDNLLNKKYNYYNRSELIRKALSYYLPIAKALTEKF